MGITKGQRQAHRQLDALYEQVPDLECEGRCAHSCTHGTGMSAVERDRIAAETGIELPAVIRGICPALTAEGRCAVYAVRPMICRLWGAQEEMSCRRGCQPVDGGPLLTDAEAMDLLVASQQVTVQSGPEAQYDRAARQLLRRMLAGDPELRAVVSSFRSGDPEAEDRLRQVGRKAARQARHEGDT